MKRIIIAVLVITGLACSRTDTLQTLVDARWIDLTHSFEENTIYWPTNKPFSKDTVFYGLTDKGYFYASFIYSAEEHGGTHFDAPLHFGHPGSPTVEQIPLEQLMGPGVVVDVSEKALEDRDYLVSVADFLAWEDSHGQIPDGSIILLRTGYGQFWPDPLAYTGTSLQGDEAVAHLRFPGLGPEAAQWLVDNRNIHLIGIDTPSIDRGQSVYFKAHRILCAAEISICENVANLDKLPESGSFIIALPMKIKGGSGAPLRIVAML
ncbi:MAG: cyclase family protein [Bacteroidia bacterium]|nr:MAG: cyclase family protein [Bacteroidia bacterium]